MRCPGGLASFGVATVLLLGLSMPTAGAASSGTGLLDGPAANPQSTSYGGYVGKAAALTARASFRVPVLTCTTTLAGIAEGVFVFNSVNTKALTGASVWITCQNGTAKYFGALEANGKKGATTFIPAPGDVITVTASQSSTGSRAVLKDVTQGLAPQQLSGTGTSNSLGLVGVDALLTSTGVRAAVPNFGTIGFSAASANGVTLSAAKAVAVDMANATKIVQVLTGPLNTAGNGFAQTFKHP